MLPKTDLHMHQEWSPRLDRMLAQQQNREPFDWRSWRANLMSNVPAGLARLQRTAQVCPDPMQADTDETFVANIAETLFESAQGGACYVEMRFGSATVLRDSFMAMFRQAEALVREHYPKFHAEALASLMLWQEPDQLNAALKACLCAAAEGMAGVDILYVPYSTEADWSRGRGIIAEAAAAGLGVTIHAGEFSTANIAAVANLNGVSRIGHAIHAASDPRLLDLLRQRGLTIEVCLSANLVLGAVPDLQQHPLKKLIDAGVPVVLGTDNPVQFGTSIGSEYALAAELGLSTDELLQLSRNGITSSFTTAQRKETLHVNMDRDCGMSLV